MEKIEANNHLTTVKKREGHTCSFYLSVVLIVGMLLQFYLPVFFETEDTFFGGYIFPLLSVAVFAFEVLFLSLRDIRISYRTIGILLAVACALIVSVLVTNSGIEKTFGLLSILFGLFILNRDPLRKGERNVIFWFFAVAIALVLLNGVRGDAQLELAKGKFNPNTCAFLLTVLFCVSFARLCSARSWGNIVFVVICFFLQFYYISRTALLGELIFVFASLVCRAWKRNSYSPRTVFWTILLFSVFGIVLAWLYAEVLFPAVGHGKIVIFGKDIFTGRQTIWGFAFDSIREHFWFGVGSHLNEAQFEAGSSLGKVVMNAHNQSVGMLAAFGIIAFILFYIAYAYIAAQPYRDPKNTKVNRFPAIFLLTITLMSYFEIYFFTLNTWIAILIAYALISSESTLAKKYSGIDEAQENL